VPTVNPALLSERRIPQPAGDPAAALPLAPEAIGVLARLGRLEIAVAGRVGAAGHELELELTGADAPALAQEGGELLEAMEHLVPRVLRGLGAVPSSAAWTSDSVPIARSSRDPRSRPLSVRSEGRRLPC
jgi:hypothetical protein